jgi:hypothetical protein
MAPFDLVELGESRRSLMKTADFSCLQGQIES